MSLYSSLFGMCCNNIIYHYVVAAQKIETLSKNGEICCIKKGAIADGAFRRQYDAADAAVHGISMDEAILYFGQYRKC